MKKLNIALGAVIFGLTLGTNLVLKHYFGLENNVELSVFTGILVGLSATVGYVYSKLQDIHEE
jgi:hypothetical protein